MTARANANAHGDAGGDDAAVLRNARPDDVAAIAVVHVRSWQATYAGHFPDDFLDALDPANGREVQRLSLGVAADDFPTPSVGDGLLIATSSNRVHAFRHAV